MVHFQRFDPVHKRAEASVKAADGKEFKVTKGAPQVILELSANAVQVKPAVEKAVNEFAARLSFVGRGAGSVLPLQVRNRTQRVGYGSARGDAVPHLCGGNAVLQTGFSCAQRRVNRLRKNIIPVCLCATVG